MGKHIHPFPACMAPDGADPCAGYHAALERIDALEDEIAALRGLIKADVRKLLTKDTGGNE